MIKSTKELFQHTANYKFKPSNKVTSSFVSAGSTVGNAISQLNIVSDLEYTDDAPYSGYVVIKKSTDDLLKKLKALKIDKVVLNSKYADIWDDIVDDGGDSPEPDEEDMEDYLDYHKEIWNKQFAFLKKLCDFFKIDWKPPVLP